MNAAAAPSDSYESLRRFLEPPPSPELRALLEIRDALREIRDALRAPANGPKRAPVAPPSRTRLRAA